MVSLQEPFSKKKSSRPPSSWSIKQAKKAKKKAEEEKQEGVKKTNDQHFTLRYTKRRARDTASKKKGVAVTTRGCFAGSNGRHSSSTLKQGPVPDTTEDEKAGAAEKAVAGLVPDIVDAGGARDVKDELEAPTMNEEQAMSEDTTDGGEENSGTRAQ
jgi:hypothetical protein